MPFYFAWVDATETTFGPEHEREDEDVFSAVIQHDEGQFPTATIEVKNPRIGLLGPTRKVWAWLAYDDGVTVEPIFFGRLVGVPDNIFAEIVSLRFIARPARYAILKQAVAQGLKVAPYYDPLYLAEDKRDDADTILEGYSALWHIDRLASDVTVSDVLVGEDGTEVFTDAEVPYESVSLSIDQPPLKAVKVFADVAWSQQYTGTVEVGNFLFKSYSGDGILNDWPKPQASLGDGWTAEVSTAVDNYKVADAETITSNFNWQNKQRKHITGDTMSITASESKPVFIGPFIEFEMSREVTPGLLDPFARDEDGDPAPINIPTSVSIQKSYVPLWSVATSLTARYEADRERNEKAIILVSADTQAIVTDDETVSDIETITVSGGDVGRPITLFLRWSTVAGQAVSVGDVIYPDTWSQATAAQLCVTAGTCGTEPPDFADVYGLTTNDGTAVWQSLGDARFTSAPGWQANAATGVGTVILPREGAGDVFYVATTGGVSGATAPDFDETPGATTNDGTVVWTSLGAGEIPIGGTVGRTGRNAYYPTERGLQSIEYLISLARARLRLRSRAVRISFETTFARALALSCRKNATINDPRLPGGAATGKVVSYTITANGDTGELTGSVTIGCAVGNGASLTLAAGTPSYVAAGYVTDGYQYTDAQIAVTDEIGYTPPAAGVDPEALSFPLTKAQAVLRAVTHDGATEAQIKAALLSQKYEKVDLGWLAYFEATGQIAKGAAVSVADVVKQNPAWFELELVPVTGGPFYADYFVTTTPLTIPKSIDLSAAA